MNKTQNPVITIFAYGTLKKGFSNHHEYCKSALNIEPATVWGRLYNLPAGFPALEKYNFERY